MLLFVKQHFQLFKANAVNGRFLAHHHVCLFTDISVIDQYFINQSTGLANNMTYTVWERPHRCLPGSYQYQSTCCQHLSFIPSVELNIGNICSSKDFFSCMELLDSIQIQCLIFKIAYFQSPMESTCINLHVKWDNHFEEWLCLDLYSEGIAWLPFGTMKTLPIKEKGPT